jgi:hypothetical protein
MSLSLFLKSYRMLIHFDRFVARRNFAALYDDVRRFPLAKSVPDPEILEQTCAAVNLACIWYWKEVLCLQRSAATACLLKRNGVSAQMIIGARQIPFKAHAWVEVAGIVINDKPYMQEIYGVLDRC